MVEAEVRLCSPPRPQLLGQAHVERSVPSMLNRTKSSICDPSAPRSRARVSFNEEGSVPGDGQQAEGRLLPPAASSADRRGGRQAGGRCKPSPASRRRACSESADS